MTLAWAWVAATSENPLRQAQEEGREAALQLRMQPLRSREEAREARSDPLVMFASSLTEVSHVHGKSVRSTVYVPAYSGIRAVDGRPRIDLATTLSIHNTSRDTPIVLERVDYHNTHGELVQAYLDEAVALKPFGTIEMFVPRDDVRGGTGANFVVEWTAATPVTEPVIEAVMIGSVGRTSYSFVSQGRTIKVAEARQGVEAR